MKQLEEIVAKLEAGNVDLDERVEMFKKEWRWRASARPLSRLRRSRSIPRCGTMAPFQPKTPPTKTPRFS
ncbi:MAG: exodeoxyribonuclease VII small subunit [Candidatus Eremiobacteraeota bacterium]|nr:exodeoxyribonuclease VII small subunit [Candidatus Eremiobacteraeota bacterium]